MFQHFDPEDSNIKDDVIRMMIQYLNDEGFHASKLTLQDEANVKHALSLEKQQELRRLRRCILDGEWNEVDRLLIRPLIKDHKSFHYSVFKQQFLEHIEHSDTQKAFALLCKRIKPLESYQKSSDEFRDLCYLLSAKSVQDAPSFKTWEGIAPGREKLVEHMHEMINLDTMDQNVYIPPNRLINMLKQAVSYQVRSCTHQPVIIPKVSTLLEDYVNYVIPNTLLHTMQGHTLNVKCLEFVGDVLASGSSDKTIRLWENGQEIGILRGHESRVWDLSSTKNGEFLASCSADATLRIWDLKTNQCRSCYSHPNDLYTVSFHPGDSHLVTGGYDKLVRLLDLENGKIIKEFEGHKLSISSVCLSPMGNLIISGSKDSTIKFWDTVSGLCIKTITSHLGEITSVSLNSNGSMLLSSSKDNSNRLWDMRMGRFLRKFKGHQNTRTNFIRSSFVNSKLIIGGSEDGIAYFWDIQGSIVQKLKHNSIVYDVKYHEAKQIFATCSDYLLKTWQFK